MKNLKPISDEKFSLKIKGHALWLETNSKYGRRANFRGVTFVACDFRGADLRGADFKDAQFRGADLRQVRFARADLRGAILHKVDLTEVDIALARGNNHAVKSIHIDAYDITYTKDTMAIGYEQHPIRAWYYFDDASISNMSKQLVEFWKNWKPILEDIGVFDSVKIN